MMMSRSNESKDVRNVDPHTLVTGEAFRWMLSLPQRERYSSISSKLKSILATG